MIYFIIPLWQQPDRQRTKMWCPPCRWHRWASVPLRRQPIQICDTWWTCDSTQPPCDRNWSGSWQCHCPWRPAQGNQTSATTDWCSCRALHSTHHWCRSRPVPGEAHGTSADSAVAQRRLHDAKKTSCAVNRNRCQTWATTIPSRRRSEQQPKVTWLCWMFYGDALLVAESTALASWWSFLVLFSKKY